MRPDREAPEPATHEVRMILLHPQVVHRGRLPRGRRAFWLSIQEARRVNIVCHAPIPYTLPMSKRDASDQRVHRRVWTNEPEGYARPPDARASPLTTMIAWFHRRLG